MSFTFTPENIKTIAKLKTRYPKPQALSLPCLWMAQYQEGFISIDAIDVIAEVTETPAMEIYRVATFYSMFHLQPITKKRVMVCKTLSCKLCGSEEILAHLSKREDVLVEEVECLGSCGSAPVMQIDDLYYEDLTTQKVDAVLEQL